MQISFSSLDAFRKCPLKYKYQEIDKIKTPPSPEAVFGTVVHSTLKYIHEGKGSFLFPTEKEALEFFSSHWNGEGFRDEIEERSAFAQGIKIIQEYYQKNNPAETKIVALESNFAIRLEDKEKKETHIISGIIDRIDKTDEGFEIIDYKTSKKLPSQLSVNENLQLLIYLLAFLERYPDQRENLSSIKLSLYYLRHGTKLSTFKKVQELEEEKSQLLETIREIEASDFSPQINPLCDWCGYQKICPMWKHKFETEEKELTDQEAEQAIKEYLGLSEKIKKDRARLAELSQLILEMMEKKKIERVFGEGKIISKVIRRSYDYDNEALKKILTKNSLWEAVLDVNKSKLKKAIKVLPQKEQKAIEKAKIIKSEKASLSVKKER